MDLRYKALSEMIEQFAIDGVVFASNRSCKVYSVMQMDLKKRLAENLDMATVMIDVDHADVRKYSEEDAFLQIEAMLESIASKK
jgi:benzoyl-CoA reductase/2-hydroxyglutaryl-CoA dehydratase subunit BcrC/BadD/HgdB